MRAYIKPILNCKFRIAVLTQSPYLATLQQHSGGVAQLAEQTAHIR